MAIYPNFPSVPVSYPWAEGQLLSYREVGLRDFNEDMDYTWCPLKNGVLLSLFQSDFEERITTANKSIEGTPYPFH
jgi:hypothetical protein